MPENKTVSTADVSRLAIDRLRLQVADAAASMADVMKSANELSDSLRELLSYCESQAQHSGYALEESAYRDVADKLRGLLVGE